MVVKTSDSGQGLDGKKVSLKVFARQWHTFATSSAHATIRGDILHCAVLYAASAQRLKDKSL